VQPEHRTVVRQSLSVGLATSAYGISFGALSVASGLDIWQTVVLSLFLFSGGSQFALVGILGAGGSAGAAIATSSLLGVRNGLYALQVGRVLEVRGARRLAAAQLTIDESTAVAIAQPTPAAGRLGFWATGVIVYLGWNLATLLGAVTAAPGREEAVTRALAAELPDVRFVAIGETLQKITAALGQLSLAAALVGGIDIGSLTDYAGHA